MRAAGRPQTAHQEEFPSGKAVAPTFWPSPGNVVESPFLFKFLETDQRNFGIVSQGTVETSGTRQAWV